MKSEVRLPRLRLLLVEDYAVSRSAAQRELAPAFAVSAVSSGEEALLRVQGSPGSFAVVLADFRMPEMTGIELLEHLRLLEPSMRRVLMSSTEVPGLAGYTAVGLVQGFLRKPFDLRTAGPVLHPEAPASPP
jgi:CheY-like chemotaxis protein